MSCNYCYHVSSHAQFVLPLQNTSQQGSNAIRVQKERKTEWARPGRVFNRNITRGGYSRSSLPGKPSYATCLQNKMACFSFIENSRVYFLQFFWKHYYVKNLTQPDDCLPFLCTVCTIVFICIYDLYRLCKSKIKLIFSRTLMVPSQALLVKALAHTSTSDLSLQAK